MAAQQRRQGRNRNHVCRESHQLQQRLPHLQQKRHQRGCSES
jgi:hypothetical protein